MKNFATLISIIALTALLTLLMQSCGDTNARNKDTDKVTETAALAIPHLKGRKEGLGSPDEGTHVASIYDKNKALIAKDPNNAEAYLALAELFMNEARVTGEHPYYYPAALKMIAAIPNLPGKSADIRFQAAYYKSSILLSQHEFQEALIAGQEGQQLFPKNAGIYGVMIDANVELGQYDEAVRLSDIMVGIRPDLRSYSRISYLREIHGDPEGAIEAMNLAVDAAMPGYEQSAWCRLTLAQLYERYGKLPEAKMHYTITLQERPDYPFAIAGLASIAAKEGKPDTALAQLDRAIALIPEVAFYEQKAELLRKLGRYEEADALAKEVMTMMAEDEASGHKMDLELSLAQLRLQGDAEVALQTCKKALAARPDNIDVNAAMAEIYVALGDWQQAKSHIDAALRTGSKDPGKNCLAGWIAYQSGDKAAGKAQIRAAFKANPSLDHPIAAQAKAVI